MKRRTSSISPASMNEPARCGPPSSRRLVTGGSREPSWSSAEAIRAGSFWPVATTTSTPAVSSASVAPRGAARDTTTTSGTSRASATSLESSGRRAVESKTTRRGWWCTASMRAVSWGSSASAVPIPTATASSDARQRWATARLPSLEIHLESPPCVATLPSRLMADLKMTSGRRVRACLRNAWFCRRARVASSPPAMSTSTPSSRRMPRPRPDAFELGSSPATTTRAIPASMIASVHGGWRPWWQHGSSETYSVAPRRSASPAARMALTSACGPPYSSCQPSPSTSSSRTMTAPTTGLGLTRPTPRSASSIARARWWWSVSVRCTQESLGTGALPAARTALQAVDPHVGPRARVGERVEVERPVEVERDRAGAPVVRREAAHDVGAALELAVVGDRARHLVRRRLRPPALGGAADDVAVALALVPVDQPGEQRALVVLDVDDAPVAGQQRAVVGDVRAAGRELDPARAVGRVRIRAPDVRRPGIRDDRLDDDLRLGRHVGRQPGAGLVAGVGPRQHEPVVHRRGDALAEEQRRPEHVERGPWDPRAAPGELRDPDDRPRPEQAHHREHRQEPAPEVALLRAHEEHVEDRRGDEPEREAAAARAHPRRAGHGGRERHPAQPPGERPQVVAVPGALSQAELAE